MAQAPTPKILTPQEITDSLIQIPNMLESEDHEFEHVIMYGDSGTGKTTLCGLLAEFYNILWFDGDKGLTAIRNNLHPELLKRIRTVRIPDSTANPIFVDTMLRVITGRQVSICMPHGVVDCPYCKFKEEAKKITVALSNLPKNWIVVQDSLTQFVASAHAKVHYRVNPAALKTGDVDDFWRGSKGDAFDYWGAMRNIMEKFGNYTKDLECQFVCISHGLMAEMDDGAKKLVPVSGSENASKNFARYFGTEINAKVVNGKHVFVSSSTYSSTVQTKSRSNIALEKMPVPSLLHIFNPQIANEQLKGSYTEWFFGDRKLPAPKPKEILPL